MVHEKAKRRLAENYSRFSLLPRNVEGSHVLHLQKINLVSRENCAGKTPSIEAKCFGIFIN